MTRVAFVLKGYPRLSETFIAQEIRALEKRGMDTMIYSLRHPTDHEKHPIHSEIEAPVAYLPEYLHDEPTRVLNAWRRVRIWPGYSHAYQIWRADLSRDWSRNRIRRFGQALVLAAEMPTDISQLHFHFIHTPASVTRYAAIMRDLPFTGSAHAKDIYTIPDWEKAEKLSDMAWLTTCTGAGAENLRALSPEAASKVYLDYHGLDLDRFPTHDRPKTDPNAPITLLSVGRAVEKKGYDDLLVALAKLPKDLNWRFVHIGGGALKDPLKATAEELGIGDSISWLGAQPQTRVLEEMRSADIFVLANKIAADGDRDGLPNVLMEAQSQALPVIATRVSATPELILHQETGWLTPPADPETFCDAITLFARDPALRAKIGKAGEERVRSNFSVDHCIDALAARFGLPKSSEMSGRTRA